MPRATSTTAMRAHWRTGVVLESLVLAGLVGTQFVASAVGKDLPSDPARPGVQQRGHPSPPALTGQLLVKYKDSVTACVHCLVKLKRPFHSATTDHSDSLDRLHARYQVTAATPIFRTEEEEAQIRGKAAQVPLVLLQQYHRQKLATIKAKFPHRTKRAPQDAVIPDPSHIYLLEVPEATDVEQAAFDFAQDSHVEYAQPNYRTEVQFIPNDPYYSSSGSWGQPYDDLWGLKKLQLGGAWDLSQGAGIVVATVDTGLDYNHPDIAANVWTNPGEIAGNGLDDDGNGFKDDTKGWDFTNCLRYDGTACTIPKCAQRFTDPTKCEDNDPWDDHGHGTHVAGTIAAVGNNGVGIVGVAPQAKVMAVKAHNSQGFASAFELARALAYAANNGAHVLNNSWACSSPCPKNQVIEEAVQNALGLGAVVVFAAGNKGSPLDFFSPQNMHDPKPIVVAATDQSDTPMSFTNVGLLLDVAAPGGGTDVTPPSIEPARNILSLKASGCNPSVSTSFCPSSLVVGTSYVRQKGTSMAAPHVSGVAALVLARNPTLTNDEVRRLLKASADDVSTPDVDLQTGPGRLNAQRSLAVQAVPQAKITSVAFGRFIDPISPGWLAIYGTASGSTFVSYELAYGQGVFPTSWVTFAGPIFTQVTTTGGALGNWDTNVVPAGTYTVRLLVKTSDGFSFQDRMLISVREEVGVQQLTSHPASQGAPAIDGTRIVWQDNRNGNDDIYLCDYDGVTKTCPEQQLTTHPAGQRNPAISGNLIVWTDSRNGNDDIYLYDLTTNSERPITTNAQTQYAPAISGTLIVWQDYRNGNWDIYLYDLSTNTEWSITTNSADQWGPAISGNRIVWTDWRNSGTSHRDIYSCLYDPTTGACPNEQITTYDTNQMNPAISGDKIVWEDGRTISPSIYLYDLATRQERPITATPSWAFSPQISGQWIVWHDYRNANYDLFLYDLATGTEQAISTHPGTQRFPRISGPRIVWEDNRNGNSDIFLSEFASPPVLAPIGNKTVSAGQLLSFPVSASDPDGELLTVTTSSLPVGASFATSFETQEVTAASAIETPFSWTPTCQQAGSYSMTFTVTDPRGLSDSETITITVTNPDTDGDGYVDCVETAIGTDPALACPATTTANDEPLDAWPLDFNDDRVCDISDVALVAGSFGQAVPPGPQRRDLNADGVIDISDVAKVAGAFGQSCTP